MGHRRYDGKPQEIDREKLDLVILDIMLPNGGWKVLRDHRN